MSLTMVMTSTDNTLKPGVRVVSNNTILLRDSSWADGLRGVASIFVVASHTILSFAPHLILPANSSNGPVDLFQRPILRLISQGPAWVALFFVLSGYVNALKPVQQARASNIDTALATLATSSFRRTGRLVLPAAAATLLSWLLCQCGAYDLARSSDASWIRDTSPGPSASWSAAVTSLFKNIFTTWMFGQENIYDQPQWALIYLFKGSMLVFTSLLATVSASPQWRTLVVLGLYTWSWASGDYLVGLNIYAGIFLAELSYSGYACIRSRMAEIGAIPLAIFGLYLCSFPNEFADFAPWSSQLLALGNRIVPGTDLGRFWPGIGAQLLAFAILFSPQLKGLLSHPAFLWLGKVSFPIYLLHGPLMRSVLAWMLFAREKYYQKEQMSESEGIYTIERLSLPSTITFLFVLPVFWCFLLAVAHFWAVKVEPCFGWATKQLEDYVFDRQGRPAILPVRKL